MSGSTTFAGRDRHDPDDAGRRALAGFLRRTRESIPPQRVGIVPKPRRRSRGLLREEVADRAGISTAWYTWLEQARGIRPSDALVERLADALLLNGVKREHLRNLARPFCAGDAATPATVSPALRQWIEALDQCPAYALNERWDVMAWNKAATNLLGDFARFSQGQRNILWRLFLDRSWRRLFVDWPDVAASAVAQFRANAAQHPANKSVEELISSLRSQSEDFVKLWAKHDLAASPIWQKRFAHRRLGNITMTYAALRPQSDGNQISVVIYTPVRAAPR